MKKLLSGFFLTLSAGLGCLLPSISLADVFSQAPPTESEGKAGQLHQVQHIDLTAHSTGAEAIQDIRDAFSVGLPLAAEWNVGQTGRGWTLNYQVELIEKGYRILPTIYNPLPIPNKGGNSQKKLDKWLKINRPALEKLRHWKLPICLRSHNWINILTAKSPSKYRVPYEQLDQSPLAWRLDKKGKPDDMPIVDPMGPTSAWRETGKDVSTSLWVKSIAEIYPDPPLIYFLENNEGARLESKHFYKKQGKTLVLKPDAEVQSKSLRFRQYLENLKSTEKPLPTREEADLLLADLYVEKYQALTTALKANAPQSWQDRILVGGYGGASTYRGRAHKPWQYDKVFEKYGFSTDIHGWDIVSPPAYINHWDNSWDNLIRSPQIQAMGLGIQFREFSKQNPDWFAEISVWSGAPKRHQALWKKFGQIYTPERYKGYVQQILWQSRVKGRALVLREFDGYRTDPEDPVLKEKQLGQMPDNTSRYTYGDYWMAVVDAVQSVNENQILREFWLKGKPIINPDPQGHYFKWIMPEGYLDDRWQLLDCTANPPREEWPRKLGMMKLNVYSIGYLLPDKPGKILIYAWSPEKSLENVGVRIPGWGSVQLNGVRPEGDFYLITHDS